MIMSEFEENFIGYFDYEEFQYENWTTSKRKDSFIDLLSPVLGIPDDNLIELHINSISNEWNPPSVKTQASESEPLELHLDEILNIPQGKAKIRPDPYLKPFPIRTFEKSHVQVVGTLTVEQRRAKIAKYLEKRKKRTWHKRIYYDCRRKVAENRLRVKGRFVTKSQAIQISSPEKS